VVVVVLFVECVLPSSVFAEYCLSSVPKMLLLCILCVLRSSGVTPVRVHTTE
jgi:hypothetical protein